MRRTRVSLPAKKGVGLNKKPTVDPKETNTHDLVTRTNMSVNMVNRRSNTEQKTGEKLIDQKNVTVAEIDLETPEQSINGMQRK